MTFEFEAINRDLSIDLDIEVEGISPRLDETTDERTLEVRQESFSVDFVCSDIDGRKTMSLEMGFCPSVSYRVNPDGTISIIIQSLAGEFVIDGIINSVFLQQAILASEARSLADAQMYTDRKWQDAQEAQALIAEALLKEFTNTISPVAINTMQAIFGSESLQYMFIVSEDDDTLKPHYVRIDYHRDEEVDGEQEQERVQDGEETDVIFPELICPDGVIKHYTLGIAEVRADMTVDSFMRWAIKGPNSDPDDPTTQETRLVLDDDDAAYYLYIKATREVVPPNEDTEENPEESEEDIGEDPPVGGVGTAEFIVSKTAIEWDSDETYYYFLYATIGRGGKEKDRAITYWNGFTEITPGRITAYKFVSPDGYQYIDFLNKIFRIGDREKFLAYNIGNDGVLRLKGTIVQSPSGAEFPTLCYRGVWIKNEEGEEPNQVAYYGDLFTYEGQSWLCIDTSAVDEDSAISENPSEDSEAWRLYSTKGETAVSSFKSIVFTRTNQTPATPVGGSYSSPIPTNTKPDGSLVWSDGVPAGEEQLWMTTRVFSNSDDPEYETEWTTPRAATDTADIDFEFSAVETNPGNPDDNPSNWHNTATSSDIWMAVRKLKNGEPVIPSGSTTKGWEISKIKGEKGEDGDSPVFADLDNEMEGVALDYEGKTTAQVQLVTNVSLSFGTLPLALTNISVSGLTTGITESHTLSSGRIVFTIASGASVGENVPITITLSGIYNQVTYSRNLTFTIAGVKAGAQGEDAIIYSILPSVSSVKKNANGEYSVSEVSCTKYKRVGNNALQTTTEGTLKYKCDNGSEQNYTQAISTSSFVTSLTFLFYIGTTLVDKETIPLLYDGQNGSPGLDGVAIRGPREWEASSSSSIVYQSGRKAYDSTSFPVDEFLDIVRYNNAYYRCKKTHISTAQTAPPTSVDQNTYWERASEYSFVATKLLLAADGKIDFLSGNVIRLLYKDSSGNETVTGGAKGAASANDIVFWAGADGTIKPLSQAPFRVLKDGTTYLSKLIIDDSTSDAQSKIILGVDGGRFFRVNERGANAEMVHIRADGQAALITEGYGSDSTAIIARSNGEGNSKAIESVGNVELKVRQGESAKVGYSNGSSFDLENIVSSTSIRHIVICDRSEVPTTPAADTLYFIKNQSVS